VLSVLRPTPSNPGGPVSHCQPAWHWKALPVATLPPAKLGGSFNHTSPATIRQVLQPVGGDAKISHVAYGQSLITLNGLYDMQ